MPNDANDPQQVNHYDGPVFNKGVSNAQLAWNNGTVTQNQQINDGSVAPGYEALAALVTDLLRQLPGSGLADRDRADAATAAEEVIAEITGSDSPSPAASAVRSPCSRALWPRWRPVWRRERRWERRSGPSRRSGV